MVNAKEKISNFLNSSWFIVLTTVIALVCYKFQLTEVTITYFLIISAYVLIFEDDVTPLFIIPIYAAMILSPKYVFTTFRLIYFGILAVVLIGLVVYFIIKQFVIKKKKFKFGKLFWAGVAVCAMCVIAGVGSAGFAYSK